LVTNPEHSLDTLIDAARPALVVIDSLRSLEPDATKDNPRAATWLNSIRALAHKYQCSFLVVHHMRKPDNKNGLPNLDDECPVNSFLLELEGPRALVNQSDVRIAIQEGDSNAVALKVKWTRRVHGDSPLLSLERVFDDSGTPQGYRLLTGTDFLSENQLTAWQKLPENFSFTEGKKITGFTDNPFNRLVTKCKAHGLIEKLPTGGYRKIVPQRGEVAEVTV